MYEVYIKLLNFLSFFLFSNYVIIHFRELLIIFLYDCELCKKEDDDPQDAIVYFYPTWVNNEQRHALCSQLMGVTQFCTNAFTVPKLISLQSGKFSIKKMGRFALVSLFV